MSITDILDAVIPYTAKCCGQRQIALKRLAFAEWIKRHRKFSDEEIIERLKAML